MELNVQAPPPNEFQEVGLADSGCRARSAVSLDFAPGGLVWTAEFDLAPPPDEFDPSWLDRAPTP